MSKDDFWKCSNCGADLNEEGFDGHNEFGEIVRVCGNCGHEVTV